MDYTKLQEMLLKLSLFDLYRLNSMVYNELDNSRKIAQVRDMVAIGSKIEYISDDDNQLISAIVLQKNQKRLLILNCHDQKEWWIRYHMINLADESIVKPVLQKLDRNNVGVGDSVGFVHDGRKIIGTVIKRNPKTATVLTNCNHTWKVSYNLLFAIIDTDTGEEFIQVDYSILGVPE